MIQTLRSTQVVVVVVYTHAHHLQAQGPLAYLATV